MEMAAEPSWVALKDEELLNVRICDLGVRIEGSELEKRVREFQDELAARGVTLRPDCYLGDEWFSPAGVPAIAIPFYLAHPRLEDARAAPDDGGGRRHGGMVPDAAAARMRPRHRPRLSILVAQGMADVSSAAPTPSTRPKPTRRARTAGASSATCRTGTRRRTRTRISPRHSRSGWRLRRTNGGKSTAAGKRWRSWSTFTH